MVQAASIGAPPALSLIRVIPGACALNHAPAVTSDVFSPFTVRALHLGNRIVMSPMLMYAADGDGLFNKRHFVTDGARTLDGVGIIVTEVLAVEPRRRFSSPMRAASPRWPTSPKCARPIAARPRA